MGLMEASYSRRTTAEGAEPATGAPTGRLQKVGAQT